MRLLLPALVLLVGLAATVLSVRGLAAITREATVVSQTILFAGALLVPVLFAALFRRRFVLPLAGMLLVWPPLFFLGVDSLVRGRPALPVAAPMPTPTSIEPVAVAPAPDPAPAPAPIDGSTSSVEYQGEGRSLRIPVVFEGRGDAVSIPWMVFDTGATFTTLDSSTLRTLGIEAPSNAPQVTLQAATGPMHARLVLVDRVQLGGHVLEGVTVAICETCRTTEATGLLGLNVSSQLQVTLDPEHHHMVLRFLTSTPDRRLDVEPWVSPSGRVTEHSGGRKTASIGVDNRALRPIEELVVRIGCGDSFHEVELAQVPALGHKEREVELPNGLACERYELSIGRALW